MKGIEIKALLAAGLQACAVFLIIDFALEFIAANVFGISIQENIRQVSSAQTGPG